MPATYIHFSKEQRDRKENAKVSWEDVVEMGLNAIEHGVEGRRTEDKAEGIPNHTPDTQGA